MASIRAREIKKQLGHERIIALSGLKVVRRNGDEWTYRCLRRDAHAHGDRTPSASVNIRTIRSLRGSGVTMPTLRQVTAELAECGEDLASVRLIVVRKRVYVVDDNQTLLEDLTRQTTSRDLTATRQTVVSVAPLLVEARRLERRLKSPTERPAVRAGATASDRDRPRGHRHEPPHYQEIAEVWSSAPVPATFVAGTVPRWAS